MEVVIEDSNGRKYIGHYCGRCGKATEGVHTCSQNPVIEQLRQERDELLNKYLSTNAALVALREQMEKQEPVAWMDDDGNVFSEEDREINVVTLKRMGCQPLYTNPQAPETATRSEDVAPVSKYHELAMQVDPALANPAPAVPAGWKLVPIEPTEEMIDAFCDEYEARWSRCNMGRDQMEWQMQCGYKAMLNAAPGVGK